ncbi:MAG: DNA polymerase III subunit delta [Gammaproteobacteria bacterium]|nr:DNA polymerase III subunit delta [Gammaproteobacteria bacterium]NVK88536.1 DNA polymerase III subunit delta [Gammaproteobacteria bacterium]
MTLSIEQLPSAVQSLATAYLITGDEPLLVMEAQDCIRNAAREQGVSERQVYEINKQFDFNQIQVSADNLSLFAEKKLLELRFDKVPDKTQQQHLLALIENLNDDSHIAITCPKLDKRQLGAKWCKAIAERGHVVQIWPVPSYQLSGWIKQRAGSLGLSLDASAIRLIAERSEGNLLSAQQSLDKISLANLTPPIHAEQVLDVIADSARYNVFELIDTALAGDGAKTTRMLQQIKAEGVVPVILVASLYREVRNLLKMSEQVARGQSVTAVVQEYRVWKSRSRIVSTALNKVPLTVWQRLVTRCAHLDKLAKGAETGNIWDELLTGLLLMGGRPLWRKVL